MHQAIKVKQHLECTYILSKVFSLFSFYPPPHPIVRSFFVKLALRLLRVFIFCICFQDKDFCIILVPHCVPEFYLIQSFFRVAPSCTSQLGRELYMFHCAGLLKWVMCLTTTSEVLWITFMEYTCIIQLNIRRVLLFALPNVHGTVQHLANWWPEPQNNMVE